MVSSPPPTSREPAPGALRRGVLPGLPRIAAEAPPRPRADAIRPSGTRPGTGPAPRSARAILFLSGFNLILLQFLMVREMTAILRGVEVVVLLVTLSYFAGYSVGYVLSDRISPRLLPAAGVITFAAHLTMPLWFRHLGRIGYGTDHASVLFLGLLVLAPFVVSAFYSLFLPRFVAATGSLARCYSVELLGALLGMAGMVLLSPLGLRGLLAAYGLALLVLLGLLGTDRKVLALLGTGALAYGALLPRLEAHSNARFYDGLLGEENVQSLFSRYSPYQKVDVIEAAGRRRLYLDGTLYYGSSKLHHFNRYLAQLPAEITRPPRALIIGSGSMATVDYVAPAAGHVTTVEIDPVVIEAGRRWFSEVNRLADHDNWDLVIDDAKHFLHTTDERFDLIVVDIPVPLTRQVALLHTVEFYRLVRSRLTPSGILSISLSGRLRPGSYTPLHVAASAAEVFEDPVVVTGGPPRLSFLFAGRSRSPGVDRVASKLREWGETGFTVLGSREVRELVGDTPPIRVDDLEIVWIRSLRRVRSRFFDG